MEDARPPVSILVIIGQDGNDVFIGVATVNDQGFVEFLRQFHLFAEVFPLQILWRIVFEIVETRLTDGDHFGMLQEVAQFRVGFVGDVFDIVRMDAGGGVDEICIPLPSYRGMIYGEIKSFIKEAKKYIPDVQATIVTHQKDVDEDQCESIVNKEFGVKYRARRYNIVG